jgi:hypothetical protein
MSILDLQALPLTVSGGGPLAGRGGSTLSGVCVPVSLLSGGICTITATITTMSDPADNALFMHEPDVTAR